MLLHDTATSRLVEELLWSSKMFQALLKSFQQIPDHKALGDKICPSWSTLLSGTHPALSQTLASAPESSTWMLI